MNIVRDLMANFVMQMNVVKVIQSCAFVWQMSGKAYAEVNPEVWAAPVK